MYGSYFYFYLCFEGLREGDNGGDVFVGVVVLGWYGFVCLCKSGVVASAEGKSEIVQGLCEDKLRTRYLHFIP